MAEELPDAPWIKKEKLPDIPPGKPDPGFWAGAGRVARGAATGAETAVDEIGMSLPGFLQGANNPEEVAKALEARSPPKDVWESGGNVLGEIGTATALTPELGLDALAVRGMRMARGLRGAQLNRFTSPKGLVPAMERITGSIAEGGGRGAVAGALMPGDDRATDAEVGAAVGGGMRGAGAVTASAVSALPPKIKNTISALAALATANKFGMPWWLALPHMGLDQSSGRYVPGVINQVYNANLADLAAKYFRGLTRSSPAALGAAGVKLKQGTEAQ